MEDETYRLQKFVVRQKQEDTRVFEINISQKYACNTYKDTLNGPEEDKFYLSKNHIDSDSFLKTSKQI